MEAIKVAAEEEGIWRGLRPHGAPSPISLPPSRDWSYSERDREREESFEIDPIGNDFELIPFGAGRRICAGKQAGLLFVQYFWGLLVHSFEWEVKNAEEMNMDEMPGLTMPKAIPLSATIRPRLARICYQ